MARRSMLLALTIAVGLSLVGGVALAAAGPTRSGDAYTERFLDDFILDLCGIETYTTVTERWTLKEYPDGSATLHVVRTFVPDDPRIPIERGAGTSFFAPDGTQRVVGMPIQLIDRAGGVLILDAGWIEFGEDITVRGPHPSQDADLAAYYCP